jgi:hypothetical protein
MHETIVTNLLHCTIANAVNVIRLDPEVHNIAYKFPTLQKQLLEQKSKQKFNSYDGESSE